MINGPYEMDTTGPLLTSRINPRPAENDYTEDFLKPHFYNPELKLQKAGHGSLIEDDKGRSWLFHLCARPLMPQMRCVLNRETSLQKVIWKEGWPVLMTGGCHPADSIEIDGDIEQTQDISCQGIDNFDTKTLGTQWYSLKAPLEENWCSLTKTPGVLSIRGRNSTYSAHDTSLVARRIQHFNCLIETTLDFNPGSYRQMAGLMVLTGSRTYYYLRKFYSRKLQSVALGILVSRNGEPAELHETVTSVPGDSEITLRCRINQPLLQFSYQIGNSKEIRVGSPQDASILSDEYTNNGPGAFDGSFCGMTAQDLDRHSQWAEFSNFSYREIESE
jgi:xylan 1,4-beta-xylosidase